MSGHLNLEPDRRIDIDRADAQRGTRRVTLKPFHAVLFAMEQEFSVASASAAAVVPPG
jgi:hypothetical protein